jgi:hypothetical protein
MEQNTGCLIDLVREKPFGFAAIKAAASLDAGDVFLIVSNREHQVFRRFPAGDQFSRAGRRSSGCQRTPGKCRVAGRGIVVRDHHKFLRGSDALYTAMAELTACKLVSRDIEHLKHKGALTPDDWLLENP